MHGNLPAGTKGSNRRRPTSRTKNTQPLPLDFGAFARFAYPVKTLESIGAALERAGCPRSRSTIATWLSGEHQAPADVAWIVLGELMKRLAGL